MFNRAGFTVEPSILGLQQTAVNPSARADARTFPERPRMGAQILTATRRKTREHAVLTDESPGGGTGTEVPREEELPNKSEYSGLRRVSTAAPEALCLHFCRGARMERESGARTRTSENGENCQQGAPPAKTVQRIDIWALTVPLLGRGKATSASIGNTCTKCPGLQYPRR